MDCGFLVDLFCKIHLYFYPPDVEVFVPSELPKEEENLPLTYERKLTLKICAAILVVSVCGAAYCLYRQIRQ